MKIFIIFLILAGVAVAGYFAFPQMISFLIEQPAVVDKLEEIAPTKISEGLAVENVKKLPAVIQYLKDVPEGIVEVDNELEGEYNVHVYEFKNGHTATFNWYRVSIKSGEVGAEFEVTYLGQSQVSFVTLLRFYLKESLRQKGYLTGVFLRRTIPEVRMAAKILIPLSLKKEIII